METKMGADAGPPAAVRSPGSGSSSSANSSPDTNAPHDTMGGGSAILSLLLPMGTVLANRYEILQVLGQGGMGAVYKVYDRELERFVALKTIRPELAANAEMLARFKQELILARQVAHRNIVRLYDIADGAGVKFITMEYIEGEDFRSILRSEGKLSPEGSVNVIRQICFALQAAHSEGVIHRDLKPQNIMRDKQGRVVVMDFGLARALESEGMTQTGALLGTMEYMSPEQAKGEQVDCTSDIYAAGLIFYELLTGKMPYAAESALASLMKRSQQRAIPASELDRGVPRNLSAIVGHCIEPDRKKRYQSASQILSDLEAFNPTAKTEIGFVVPRRAHTSPVYKRVALALMVVVLAAAGYVGWKKFGTATVANHAPVSVLVADFENHTGDPVFDGTLEPMFNAALEDAKFVNAFSRGEARKLAAQLPNHPDRKIDEQAARLIAQSQGIGAVITGSFSRRGDNTYKISVEAIDGSANGKSIASAETTVESKDEVMLAVPKLVAPIRKALGDTTPESVQLAATQGSFKVANLEAAHQYGLGMELQFAGKWKDALSAFSKATELDPNFARAYAGMAMDARNLGQQQEVDKSIKLALEHVDQLTERERLRLRGAYYFLQADWPKCVDEYKALVSQYPFDNIGHVALAGCYSKIPDMAKALEEGRRAVELSPKTLPARMNLAVFATYAGDFQTAEKEARTVLQLNPAYEKGYLTLAYAQLGQGRLDEAALTYQTLAKLSDLGASFASAGLADLDTYQGKFSEAQHAFEQGAKADLASKRADGAAGKLAGLAYAQLSMNRKREAVSTVNRALAISKAVKLRLVAGRILVAAGESKKALEIASDLDSMTAPEPRAYANIIRGEAALEGGSAGQALKFLGDARTLMDSWIGRFDSGLAYLKAGLFVEADSEFDRCMQRRGEAVELFVDDVPTYGYFPPIFYYQGRVRDGLKSAAAPEAYRTYLKIRGDAGQDPLLAEIRHRLGQ
jgi:tetratricopeptide (TPR) repeat protein/predicted Ser/Thr protein kinase